MTRHTPTIILIGAVIATDQGPITLIVPISGSTKLQSLPGTICTAIARRYPQHINAELLEIRYDVRANAKVTP